MSKVTEAFTNGKAFIPFLTAGDPDLVSTEKYILELEKAGADLIIGDHPHCLQKIENVSGVPTIFSMGNY